MYLVTTSDYIPNFFLIYIKAALKGALHDLKSNVKYILKKILYIFYHLTRMRNIWNLDLMIEDET